jgi:hypothetical protein
MIQELLVYGDGRFLLMHPPHPLQVELAVDDTDSIYEALTIDFSPPHGDFIYDNSTVPFSPFKEFSCNSP